MNVRDGFAVRGWLAALTLVSAAAPAESCGFCYSLGGNPLALPHPKAIEIAVATRAALDKKLLDEGQWVPGAEFGGGAGMVALKRVPAPALVRAWAEKCPRPPTGAAPLTLHVLFIDTEQSCGLIARGGVVLFEPGKSAYSDARLVTTRPTFHALLAGQLSLAEARRLGLLHLEGDARALRVLPGATAARVRSE